MRAVVMLVLGVALVMGMCRSRDLTLLDGLVDGALAVVAFVYWVRDHRALRRVAATCDLVRPARHAYRDLPREATTDDRGAAVHAARSLHMQSASSVVLAVALTAGMGLAAALGPQPARPSAQRAWSAVREASQPFRERDEKWSRAYDDMVFVDDGTQRGTLPEYVVQLLPDRTCVDRMPFIYKHAAPPCVDMPARRAHALVGGHGARLLELVDKQGARHHFLLRGFGTRAKELEGIASPPGAANLSERGVLVAPSPGGLEVRDLVNDVAVFLPMHGLRGIGGWIDDEHILVLEDSPVSLDVAAALASAAPPP